MATFYVSTTGNDANSGTSIGLPKRHITNGCALPSPGDTVLVRGGVYDEDLTSCNSGTGTSWDSASLVRIAAYPGETVWMRPTTDDNAAHSVIWLDGSFHYIEFDGINIDGSLAGMVCGSVSTNNGFDPHHIRFKNLTAYAGVVGSSGAFNLGEHALIGATGFNQVVNCTIHGGGLPGNCGFPCASYGVYIKGPDNLVENCDIYDTSGAFVQIYNASGDAPDRNIVRNNRLHNLTRAGITSEVWGILIAQGTGNLIINNLIYGIAVGDIGDVNLAGIAIAGTSTQVLNNTVYNNRNTGILVGSTAVGAVVRNNISYFSTGSNYLDLGGSGTVHDHNLEGVNPLFVNAGSEDFRLLAGSPAIDAGTTLASVTDDFVGTSRPQGSAYDIGAYEFTAALIPPAAPTGLRIVT